MIANTKMMTVKDQNKALSQTDVSSSFFVPKNAQELFTGKGILNPVCDGMLLEVLKFLED